MADNLATFWCRLSRNSESLDLVEPWRPVQASLWIAAIQQHADQRIRWRLGAFAELRKATISFVVSLCPSVRPHGTTSLRLDGFYEVLGLRVFQNVSRNFIKIMQV
jgi:hypothetical protein